MLDAMEVPSHARHLLLQLNSQRTKGFLCDVIIVVQNALFRAHKNILAASSLYLKSLVVHDNLINLDHEMVSPGVFRVILDYIYTGRLNDGDQGLGSEPNLGAVLAAASYLQLLDLVALCRKKLKRNGKYHHLRPTHGFAPYSKIGVGGGGRYRVSAPVIQSCFPGGVLNRPPQSEELPPHPLVTHVGEMYAPPSSQGPQIYPAPPPALPLLPQSSLRSSAAERDCSPLYGLDLSKKSPDSQSTLSHPNLSHALLQHDEGRHSPAPPGTNGGPLNQSNDSAFSGEVEVDEYKGSLSSHPHLAPRLPHLQRSDSRGPDPYPCPPSAGSETGGEGGGEQGSETGKVYRWVKPEPLPYPPEDEEEDDEEEEEDEEGVGGERGKETNHRHHNHHKNGEEHKLGGAGRPGGYGCEGEDEKSGSASEETGSSEGRPSPIFHMPYEPESFGDNLYVCIPCDKGFPSSEQLNAHVETHTEEELYGHPAGELGSSNGHGGGSNATNVTPTANSLSAPLGLGAGAGSGEVIRPYRCSSCDKSYKDPATLRQHEKSHWLTRPYPCSICGKKFTQRGTMTRHMRSHLGLKPFACDACGMRFTRQYRLTEHMRIHSGEKPYECQVCGGKFAQQRNLISHMKMHSGGGVADGKLKMDFTDGIYPLGKYAEHLGLKHEKASALLAQASQHLLSESLYPLSKLAAEHLGLIHDKMDALRQPLGPPLPSQQHSSEPRAIDRYSPS